MQNVFLFCVDALYLTALAIGRMLADGITNIADGGTFRRYVSNVKFTGVSGPVILDAIGERQPSFGLYTTMANGTMYPAITIDASFDTAADGTVTIKPIVKELYANFWVDGVMPDADPACGFTGELCDDRPVIYGCAAGAVALCAAVLAFFYWRHQ